MRHTCCICLSSHFSTSSPYTSGVDFCLKDNVGHTKPISSFGAPIHECLIPALTGHPSCSSHEHSYLALPVRLGVLGKANPTETSTPAFFVTVKLTASLTDNVMIMSKGTESHLDYNLLQSLKRDISLNNHKSLQQKAYTSYYLHRCNAALIRLVKKVRPYGYPLQIMASI